MQVREVSVSLLILLATLTLTSQSQKQIFTVEEESAVGTEVGTVQVPGKSVESFQTGDHYFKIDERTGVLRVKRRLDRDADADLCNFPSPCRRVFNLIVDSSEQVTVTITVEVIIKDKNDNKPRWPSKQIRVTIPENIKVIHTLPMAIDPDEGVNGITSYTLRVNTPLFKVIYTQNRDGILIPKLQVLKPLDRETKKSYTLSLLAFDGKDGSGDQAETKLVIYVTDVNDNTPEFTQPSPVRGKVKEDAEYGKSVVTVHAKDRDEGKNAEIIYSIAPESIMQLKSAFQINPYNGEILVYRGSAIDYEKKQVYRFKVLATDKGEGLRQTSIDVEIAVINTNDHKPIISHWSPKKVFENEPAGQLVRIIAVKDKDAGLAGEVKCVIDHDDFQLTLISKDTNNAMMYNLTTKSEFDREKISEYSVIITCEDRGVPRRSSNKRIKVPIEDKNDCTPTFSGQRQYMVQEEITKNVVTLQAIDEDAGDNSKLTYKLVWDDKINMAANPFQIDSQGQIEVAKGMRIDREKYVNQYGIVQPMKFDVVATDHGNPPRSGRTQVQIILKDINDNPPVFEKRRYNFAVEEHSPEGSSVGTVKATDLDNKENNGKVEYTILTKVPFKVLNIGNIYVDGYLDRERVENGTYTFKVLAKDQPLQHGTQKTATTTVVVKLIDKIDHSPRFVYPNATSERVRISYREPVNYIVAHIRAVGLDEGNNGRVQYSLTQSDGNLFKNFHVDKFTGDLKVIKEMDRSQIGLITLTITARYMGKPSLLKTQSLHLEIDDSVPKGRLMAAGRSDMEMNKVIIIGITTGVICACAVLVTAICIMARRQPCLACPSGNKGNHAYSSRGLMEYTKLPPPPPPPN